MATIAASPTLPLSNRLRQRNQFLHADFIHHPGGSVGGTPEHYGCLGATPVGQ